VAMIKASNRNLTLIHFSPSRLLTAADCCWFRGPGLVVCLATNYRTSEFIMCNLYYADFWIMPTIGSKRALAAAIAALESA
jgi:hypothetical protein